jgi:hypothetical protein
MFAGNMPFNAPVPLVKLLNPGRLFSNCRRNTAACVAEPKAMGQIGMGEV